jgi:hypothetical protein
MKDGWGAVGRRIRNALISGLFEEAGVDGRRQSLVTY